MATITAATRAKLDQLHPDLRRRVEALMLASPSRIGITSAWRSSARQAELYAGWKARRPGFNPANRPGTSKHERERDGQPAAEAADLAWPNDGTQRWGHANARAYGLHFPIRSEDWHVESNGRPYNQPAPAPQRPQEDDDMSPQQAEDIAQRAGSLAAEKVLAALAPKGGEALGDEFDKLRRDMRKVGEKLGFKAES